MKRPALKDLTLRQKIGQTGFPSPRQLLDGVIEFGGYDKYLQAYPFTGVYLWRKMWDHNNVTPATPEESAKLWKSVSDACDIPLLVAADAEHGASGLFDNLHKMPTMMALGAAHSGEMAYMRSYYYAKEMKQCGVNWSFSPVCDLSGHLLAPGVIRTMSDNADLIVKLIPDLLRGYADAGIASTAKHYPGTFGDYRDSHFTANSNRQTKEEWDNSYRKIWQAAVDAGAPSIMVSHCSLPCIDDSFAKGTLRRPASASKKIVDVLRYEMGYKGVIVTDAVGMKGVAAAFEHEDVYIECFNAGNDIILFCGSDYIDVMERAIADGRVSMQQLDAAVERILDMKEALGLFDRPELPAPLTEEENQAVASVTYEVAKKAITLVNNVDNMIPFDPKKVKNVLIVKLSPAESFNSSVQKMVEVFAERGIHADLVDRVKGKPEMKEFSEKYDMIIFACYMSQSEPEGYAFYSRHEDLQTLMAALSYGAEKTVAISFGTPAIYFNYFEQSNAFLNTYSNDLGAVRAVVEGILGDFEFVGKSPRKLSL